MVIELHMSSHIEEISECRRFRLCNEFSLSNRRFLWGTGSYILGLRTMCQTFLISRFLARSVARCLRWLLSVEDHRMDVMNQFRLRKGVAPPGNETRGEGHRNIGELRAPVFLNVDATLRIPWSPFRDRIHEEWRKRKKEGVWIMCAWKQKARG